jgi:hypothetical protein
MNKPDEISLPIWSLVTPLIAILLGIGWFASPRDENNRPLLLLPDVKAVEEYRRLANRWRDELRLVDGEIALTLAGDTSDLLSVLSSAKYAGAQSTIIQEIDQALRRQVAAKNSSASPNPIWNPHVWTALASLRPSPPRPGAKQVG